MPKTRLSLLWLKWGSKLNSRLNPAHDVVTQVQAEPAPPTQTPTVTISSACRKAGLGVLPQKLGCMTFCLMMVWSLQSWSRSRCLHRPCQAGAMWKGRPPPSAHVYRVVIFPFFSFFPPCRKYHRGFFLKHPEAQVYLNQDPYSTRRCPI